jgi:hypothetical protein
MASLPIIDLPQSGFNALLLKKLHFWLCGRIFANAQFVFYYT